MDAEVRQRFVTIADELTFLQHEARSLGDGILANSAKLDTVLSILSRAFTLNQKQTDSDGDKTTPERHDNETIQSSLAPNSPVRKRRNSHVTFPPVDSSPALTNHQSIVCASCRLI